jgi:NAD(P)-dependent dehydrogenase (short-subunit alcohol dehydrogenase family)
VIVTGGASGIGASIAAAFLDEQAKVAILDRDISSSSHRALAIGADVTQADSVGAAVKMAVDTFSRIDILINCAGIGAIGTVADNDLQEWGRVLDVNLLGTVRVTQACLSMLLESPAGSIVNVSSIAANAGIPERAAYSASKGAVSALTRAMAADFARTNLRVNSISPGTAETPWVDRLLSSATDPIAERRALMARQPHGRLVAADEIALATLYLADPRNRSTNGVDLAIDGGMQNLRLRSGT